MASAINNGTFTFNKEELQDWAKVIHTMVFNDPELNTLHYVEEGVKWNKQIVISNNEGLMGKKVTGCAPNEISGVVLSEKTWTPAEEDFRLKHCSADVNQQDKLVNKMTRMNPDFYDIFSGSQSSTGAFLVASVMERLQPELIRKAWFNELNADTIENGGTLVNGTDKGYFNTFNGLFWQFMNNSESVAKRRFTIAKNAGASYAAQELATGDGLAILRGLWKKSDLRLRGMKNAYIAVTQTVYDQYVEDLENVQNVGAGNTKITEDDQVIVKFRGKTVIPVGVWDRTIAKYYDNGTKLNMPHRAVMTVDTNVPIGTLAKGDFGTVEAFYDKVSKQNYIDGIYTIDAKILEDYLIAMAY